MIDLNQKTISTDEALGIVVDKELGTITKTTLISWVRKNKLGKKVGGRWRINEEKFFKYLGVTGE